MDVVPVFIVQPEEPQPGYLLLLGLLGFVGLLVLPISASVRFVDLWASQS